MEQQLHAPFPASELEWRVGSTFSGGSKGMLLPYVTARGIQNRLDTIFGVGGWSSSYQIIPDCGVVCTIKCKLDDGDIVEKSDGAGFTQVEGFKGGISASLKRAASSLGIGRYLYYLDNVKVDLDNKKFKGKVILPDEFLPESERTGNTQLKVEYYGHNSFNKNKSFEKKQTSSEKHTSGAAPAEMDFVIRDGSFNDGKKMGDVPIKSLKYMVSRGASEEIRAAAEAVLKYKG